MKICVDNLRLLMILSPSTKVWGWNHLVNFHYFVTEEIQVWYKDEVTRPRFYSSYWQKRNERLISFSSTLQAQIKYIVYKERINIKGKKWECITEVSMSNTSFWNYGNHCIYAFFLLFFLSFVFDCNVLHLKLNFIFTILNCIGLRTPSL